MGNLKTQWNTKNNVKTPRTCRLYNPNRKCRFLCLKKRYETGNLQWRKTFQKKELKQINTCRHQSKYKLENYETIEWRERFWSSALVYVNVIYNFSTFPIFYEFLEGRAFTSLSTYFWHILLIVFVVSFIIITIIILLLLLLLLLFLQVLLLISLLLLLLLFRIVLLKFVSKFFVLLQRILQWYYSTPLRPACM